LGVPVTQGTRIDSPLETMGAYKAGLRKDDVLVQFNGKPITNDFGSLVTALQGKKGGDEVEVVFYRGPEKKTVIMELSKRPVPEIPWQPAELARQVRAKYDESLAALEQCFQGVTEAEADHEPAAGEWSAKQTLAHLIQTERNWIANLDDVVGGYERLADDWGGNLPAHINATLMAYKNVRGLLAELKRLALMKRSHSWLPCRRNSSPGNAATIRLPGRCSRRSRTHSRTSSRSSLPSPRRTSNKQ